MAAQEAVLAALCGQIAAGAAAALKAGNLPGAGPGALAGIGAGRVQHETILTDSLVAAMPTTLAPTTLAPGPLQTPSAVARPDVSVIMAVRDRADVVGAAIASVVAQGFTTWELIIVDDGSSDATADVLASWAEDPRIQVERTPPRGQAAARNIGWRRAKAAVVAYLDSDNLMLPGYLAEVVRAFGADPALACAYAALVADAPLASGGHVLWPAFDCAALLRANAIDLNVFSHRHSLAEEVGGFDESLTRLVDWDFVLRCTARTVPQRLALAGALYRTGRDDRVSNIENLGENSFRVRCKWLPPLPRALRVLYVVWHYPQLSETYIEAEIRSMLRRGVAVEVWSEDDVAVPYTAAAPWHRGTLADAIKRVRPDIVHIHWINIGVKHAPAAAAHGIPVTVRCHGFEVTVDTLRLLLAQPGVAAVHLFPHQIATLGVVDARLRPLPVAFDTALFRPVAQKDRRLVVRTATALPAKDFALFFELARRMPEYRFVLAACTAFEMEHFPPELRALAESMGSPVELHFDLPQAEVAVLVGRAGIYLHTVVAAEAPGFTPIGMPISIAEAMATGAVPVVRDLPGLMDYVGPAGFAYQDIDGAEAAIRATEDWDDAAWQAAWRRAVDQAYLNHADDVVLQPLLDDWLALASPALAAPVLASPAITPPGA